jgi:molybdate transport system substrate-binding protein
MANAAVGANNLPKINLFAAANTRPVVEELIGIFEPQNSCKIFVTYGGSGLLLAQIKLSKTGDVYLAAGDRYMNQAQQDNLVLNGTRLVLSYLFPALAVSQKNPKRIYAIHDLLQEGKRIKVCIARPDIAPAGDMALSILRKEKLYEKLRGHIVEQRDVQATFNAIVLGFVDAAIVYDVCQQWNKTDVEVIPLINDYPDIYNTNSAAVLSFTKNRNLAEKFVKFMASPKGKEIFKKHGYSVDFPEK